jgi:glycosyltransferase involved in cell wall biosynthesis
MDYLMVVEAPCYEVAPGRFATESAFAEHLRMLRARLGDRFERFVVAAPSLSDEVYDANRGHLGEIDEADEGISYVPLHTVGTTIPAYWFGAFPRIIAALWREVGRSLVVHSGIAHDVFRPTPFVAIAFAILRRRKSLFFIDIDFRGKARKWYQLGEWSRRAYRLNEYVLDPIRVAQVWLAVRLCSLCLLKSAKLVEDFGGGRPNVRNFFNTSHAAQHVISDEQLEKHVVRLRDSAQPLRLVFFGRFVKYKGLDRTIRAVAAARERSGRPIELWLVGRGDQQSVLEVLVDELEAREWVRFREPVPFGTQLFELLQTCSLAVATPLIEDTPRAAFDAMACGLPVLGFDIVYYQDLRETGAVETSPWPDVDALADQIVALDANREHLAALATRAVAVARENTQEIWLDRRVRWTLDLLD